MHKDMPHCSNGSPISIWVCVLKVQRKHIRGFANDFYVLNKGIIEHTFLVQLLRCFSIGKSETTVNSLYDMFQSLWISNRLSHK